MEHRRYDFRNLIYSILHIVLIIPSCYLGNRKTIRKRCGQSCVGPVWVNMMGNRVDRGVGTRWDGVRCRIVLVPLELFEAFLVCIYLFVL